MISFKNIVLLLTSLIGGMLVKAQNAPIWIHVNSGLVVSGLELNSVDNTVTAWGTSLDTICWESAAALIIVDTAGSLITDTIYELNNCWEENPVEFTSNRFGSGYYLVTSNDVTTPQDSSYVYYIDNNFAIAWGEYVGQTVRSEIVSYKNKNYLSSDNFSLVRQVLKFDASGLLDTVNAVTPSYFIVAPPRLICQNGLVMEFANKPDLDTAFLCMVYDTSGNYFTGFAFDADVNEQEVQWYVGLSQNQLFHVSSDSPNNRTYPACSGITGITNWIDTIYHQMHGINGACTDTINNAGFVLCDIISSSGLIYSYDLFTGQLIDSIIIDSVDAQFTGIKSGPAGGVYFVYAKRFTTDLVVEQYDAGLNLLWRGTAVNPSCSSACDTRDFLIDSSGFVYLLGYCGACPTANMFIAKFAPSLVGIHEINPSSSGCEIYPNPTSTGLSVETKNYELITLVEIFDSAGKLVLTVDGSNTTVLYIETNSLAQGNYIAAIGVESGQTYFQKFNISSK